MSVYPGAQWMTVYPKVSILWLESSVRATADASSPLRFAQHDRRFWHYWLMTGHAETTEYSLPIGPHSIRYSPLLDAARFLVLIGEPTQISNTRTELVLARELAMGA